MKQIILSVVWVIVAAVPTLNAQENVKTAATQQTPKPKTSRTRALPQPDVHQMPTPIPMPAIGHNKTTNDNRGNYMEAMRRYRHERHDQEWWKRHYVIIVLVGGGYYYWDSGYWYPAWGYNSNYERYDYDGPIYTYGNLLPDQVVINVQHALKEIGYYAGDATGSLGTNTRRALTAYQEDAGLDITGAVDEATVRALGLI